MMADWELGTLYWRQVDKGETTEEQAAQAVKRRFFDEICGPDKDTYFYIGTTKDHPNTWIVLGAFYPKNRGPQTGFLFDM